MGAVVVVCVLYYIGVVVVMVLVVLSLPSPVYNTLLDDDADLAVDFAARHRPSLCVSDGMMNNFRTRPTRK